MKENSLYFSMFNGMLEINAIFLERRIWDPNKTCAMKQNV
jgi:hypothetical protein